ncbi:hypothetical protein C2857_002846 [Epichloe festucae Fl1]|uniref:Siderophore biosynthesis enzyme n=1 Tax=Epichloe festucae (strain Fl1) TaxID=877507 RepID=A0A7U3Q0E8_EPIFF|nr:hypothetical protein C2857_002846 [Epichloe festucae Fl1]
MAVRILILTVALCLGSSVLARTNLQGCTYYDSVIKPSQQAAYATRLWYVPDSGEVCKLLDCGGGRAPPKTTVPGCPLYEGTETHSPSFIDPKTLGQAASVAPGGRSGRGTSTASGGITTITAAAPATTTSVASSAVVETSASASASWSSAKNTQSGSTSGSTTGRDGPTSTSTGAAGSLVTGAAALAPCLVAGVAAGLGLF